MRFTLYLLPDGSIVPVDSTAAKGALTITYQLRDRSIVNAIRLDATSIGKLVDFSGA